MNILKYILCFCFLEVIGFPSSCQVLDLEESIDLLELGGQSKEIVDEVADNAYALPELEQCNELKKAKISDKWIIFVLKNRFKLSTQDIQKLADYINKGYSDKIINSVLAEKPKFQVPIKRVKEPNIESSPTPPKPASTSPEQNLNFSFIMDEKVVVPNTRKEVLLNRCKDWAKSNSKQTAITNDKPNSLGLKNNCVLPLSKPVQTNSNKKVKGLKLKFILKLECTDNELAYKIDELEYEYSMDGFFVLKPINQSSDLKSTEFENQAKEDLNAFIQNLKKQIKAEGDNDW